MGSLTNCIKKAGKAITAEDKAAVLERAAELREGGMSNADASVRAVEEQIAAIKALIVSAGGDPAESANVPKAKAAANDDVAADGAKGDATDLREPSAQAYNVEARRKPYTDDAQLQLFLDNGPIDSQAGPRGEAAQREAVAAVDDLRSSGSVLAQALSSDYAARQRVTLVGQKVASTEDLATLAQVYRDPRFETLRIIFTGKGGAVVTQLGITSRLPASAPGIVGDDLDEYMSKIMATAKLRGATGYYMLHNHPSGMARSSRADESLTAAYASKTFGTDVQFLGHVVIDTNEYSVINGRGESELFKKDFGQPAPYRDKEWDGVRIGSVDDAMRIAKRLHADDGAVTLIHTDSQYNVKTISTIPASAITASKDGGRRAILKASLKAVGSQVFAVGSDAKALGRIYRGVTDAILVNPDGTTKSYAASGLVASSSPFPDRRKTILSPDTASEFAYLANHPLSMSRRMVAESAPILSQSSQTDTPEFKRWFGASVVTKDGKAGGEPLVVYRGGPSTDWQTGKDITEFRSKNGPWAGFFTDKPEVAERFVYGSGSVAPVFIRAIKPLAVDAEGLPARNFQIDASVVGASDSPLRQKFLDGDYDALILRNTSDEGTVYVPKRPEQIKSAIGNRGAFDPQSPSILLSQAAKFKPGTAKASIQTMVDASRASWSDAPPVTVVDSVDGLPTHIQDAIASQGATGTVRALVMPDTGRVYLIADRLKSVAEAQFVLFHEVLGHYGMRKFLGDKYAPELDKLRKANPALAKEAMRWFQAYGQGHINARTSAGMDFTQAVREVSLLSVEEALADRAGDAKPLSGFKAFMAKVQAALRNIGLGKVSDMLEGMTEAETFALLAHARRSVESGPARESFAIGLKGPLNQQDAPILSQPDPIAESQWSIGDSTRLDDLIFNYQDKQVDLRRSIQAIRTAGRELEDRFDAYLQEELYHGRSAKRVEDFADLELAPLLKDMAARGITQERLDEYLLARHAKEANDHVAKINRKPDHGQIGIDGKPVESPLQDGGSGMETGKAKAFLDGLDPAEKKRLEAVAAKVDAIIAKNRALVVSYGLESAETVNGWAGMFKHYVPLMREDEGGGMGTGQGFSIKGKEAKHRTGSTAKVVDILANIAMQRERTIVRGEKNRVAVALAGLVHTNPNPELWSLVPTKERFLNERTGLVETRDVPNLKSLNNVVVAKIRANDGSVQERAIVFNEKNERAQRMAAALKNLDAAQVEGVLTLIQPVTRYMASINTQYNPIFGIVNFLRDVQGALLNLGSTEIAGEQAKVAAESAKLFGQVLKSGFRIDKSDAAALWSEFQDEGGATGFKELFRTSEDRARDIEKQLDPDWWTKTTLGKIATVGGLASQPMSAAHQKITAPLFDWLSDYNTALENVVRMAAYKVAREKGISKQRSASLAKNLTVNFNRKGSKSPGIAALYAFFNASVQGTARLAQTLVTMEGGDIKTLRLSKAGKQIVAGGVLLGVLQAIALHLAGYDDENPPEYVRERNFIIPFGERGKYITIPMPLGFHVLPGLGRIATEFFLSGGKDPGKRVGSIASMLMGTFNPIGGSASVLQTITPTFADPIAALAENKDFTGSPISRTTYSKNEPGFRNAKDTATPWGKFIAEAVNTLSGGSSAKKGALSPTPDDIDYLIGQATGGVGREVGKMAEVASAAKSGEVAPPNKMPLVGRFFGDAASSSGQARQFYAHVEKIREAADVVKTMRKNIRDGIGRTTPEDLKAHIEENKLLPLSFQADSLAKRLKAMRQERRKHLEAGNRARVVEIEKDMKKLMTDFNDRVRAMEKKSAGVAKPKELEYQ